MFLVFLNLEVLQNMHVSDRKKGTDLQEIQIGAILLRTKNKFETSLLPQNACLYNFHVSEDWEHGLASPPPPIPQLI